ICHRKCITKYIPRIKAAATTPAATRNAIWRFASRLPKIESSWPQREQYIASRLAPPWQWAQNRLKWRWWECGVGVSTNSISIGASVAGYDCIGGLLLWKGCTLQIDASSWNSRIVPIDD